MNQYKVILSDLDGTLLTDDKRITQNSLDTIKQVQEKGILFGVSTSRSWNMVDKVLGNLKPDFLILNGGALVVKDNKVIYTCEFSVEETRTILETAYKVCGEDVEITLDNATELVWNRTPEQRSTDMKMDCLFDDFKDFKRTGMKICVQTEDKEKAYQIASSIGLENVDYLPFSDIPWYKFSKSGATKEKAINALSAALNIGVDQMIAFGDDFNDIGMLQLCGKGVAMENAIPEVKAASNDSTTSNQHDGVAEYIKRMWGIN